MNNLLSWVAKIKIRSLSPTSLSKIRNCSPAFVTWYLSGNTGISSLSRGVGGKPLSFRCEWIARTVINLQQIGRSCFQNIVKGSSQNLLECVMCCLKSSFYWYFFFCDLNLILWWWVRVLVNFPGKFTIYMKLYFCFTLCPLRRSKHSEDWRLFDSFFWKTYRKPFELTFSHLFQLL